MKRKKEMVAEQIDELSKKRAHEEALGVTPTPEGAGGQPRCAMCGGGDVKYRCPRCERITCSLACCVDHKRVVCDCRGFCLSVAHDASMFPL